MSFIANARALFAEERDIDPLPWEDFLNYFNYNGLTYPFMGGSTWVPESLGDAIVRLKPKRVIFNPGAESPALRKKLEAAGIRVLWECTLVLLRTRQFETA